MSALLAMCRFVSPELGVRVGWCRGVMAAARRFAPDLLRSHGISEVPSRLAQPDRAAVRGHLPTEPPADMGRERSSTTLDLYTRRTDDPDRVLEALSEWDSERENPD